MITDTKQKKDQLQDEDRTHDAEEECLDEIGDESFPASDPPALGGGSAGGPKRTGQTKP